MLLFKKKFLPAIRTGEKTQTIRLGKVCRYRSGQRSYIPGIGYITIESVDTIPLAALTEEDAVRDGFATLADLHAELDAIYPESEPNSVPFHRIRFRVLPPEEQQRLRDERSK